MWWLLIPVAGAGAYYWWGAGSSSPKWSPRVQELDRELEFARSAYASRRASEDAAEVLQYQTRLVNTLNTVEQYLPLEESGGAITGVEREALQRTIDSIRAHFRL